MKKLKKPLQNVKNEKEVRAKFDAFIKKFEDYEGYVFEPKEVANWWLSLMDKELENLRYEIVLEVADSRTEKEKKKGESGRVEADARLAAIINSY